MNALALYFEQHESQISLGVGMAFLGAAMFKIGQATYRATLRIQAKKKKIAEESIVKIEPEEVKLPPKEVVKEVWKEFVGASILAVGGTALVVKAYKKEVDDKSSAIINAMLAEEMATRYRNKNIELSGESKDRKVIEEVGRQSATDNPPQQTTHVYSTGNGDTKFYIPYLKIWFRSSPEAVNDGLLEFCRRCDTEGMSVRELLSYLDITDEISIPFDDRYTRGQRFVGDNIGWNADDRVEMKVEYTNAGTEPCGIILFQGHKPWPHANFWGVN